MIYRLLFICYLFSFTTISYGYGNDDPWIIINNATKATKLLNYKGIFHSQHHKEIKSIEITHTTNNDQEFIKMNVLDGSPGAVLSQGKTIYVYNTIENIKENWSKQFQILEIYESIIGNNQDLVVLRKLRI